MCVAKIIKTNAKDLYIEIETIIRKLPFFLELDIIKLLYMGYAII